MVTDDQIRDEKLQYYIDRETAKIPPLSSGEIESMNILQVKRYYHLIKSK